VLFIIASVTYEHIYSHFANAIYIIENLSC
jgi:hypothetical protein